MTAKEENKMLRKYIMRGGFIKDRNGRWCKEGDTVRYKHRVTFAERIKGHEKNMFKECFGKLEYRGPFWFVDGTNVYYFGGLELVEPCESDICAILIKRENDARYRKWRETHFTDIDEEEIVRAIFDSFDDEDK